MLYAINYDSRLIKKMANFLSLCYNLNMSKRNLFFTTIFFILFFSFCFLSCNKKDSSQQISSEKIIVGFSQIGAESAWRTCHTSSIRREAERADVQLVFENAEQKQENQIRAIRSFIIYQVDVIAFVPIVTDGWDTVLGEARDAGIPVLVVDRKINTSDETLYAGFVGTDSEKEGRNCARFLQKKFMPSEKNDDDEIISADDKATDSTDDSAKYSFDRKLRIFEIRGTENASVTLGRAAGFREIILHDDMFEIIGSESGDFLRSRGKEVMANALDKYENIDIIFSHNDGMTLGILDELESRNIAAGKDICIVSVDGEQAAINAIREGKINFVAECNPFQGQLVMALIKKIASGQDIPRQIYVEEQVFGEDTDLTDLPLRGY